MDAAIDRAALQDAAEAACRAALRAGLAASDARDLAQDALLRALSSARPPAGVPLTAWVYGIARNLGRDHAKSAKRREVPVDELPAREDDGDDLTTVLAVRRALHDLPEPLRDVITLHELEELSLRETALALQIPFDTAKDRLRRARAQLRASLGDDAAAASARERADGRRRSAAHGAAILAAVFAVLGERAAIAAAGGGAGAAAVGGGAGAATGGLVRRGLAALVVGGLAAGGFAVGRLTASPRRAPAIAANVARDVSAASPARGPGLARTSVAAAEPASAGSAGSAIASPLAPVPAPTRASAVARRVPAPRVDAGRTPGAPADPGAAERLLIDRARVGLDRGLPDEALVTLMSHARRFPHGKLAEERDVLIIEAYIRGGHRELAKRRIDLYTRDHPDGVLRARVAELAAGL